MVGKVNETMCTCWGGCCSVSGVSESDMRDAPNLLPSWIFCSNGGDDPTDIPIFVSGLLANCQHSLPESRDAKNTVPVWTWRIRTPKF